MLHTLLLLAQDAAGKDAATKAPQGGGVDPFIFVLGIIFFLFYFLVLRPMKRQEQEKSSLLTNLKKNDKVLTTAGIYGTVLNISDTEDEVVVKVDDNVRLKMVKASIARNLTNEETLKAAKDKDKAKASSTSVTTGA